MRRESNGEPNLGNELIKYVIREFPSHPLAGSLRRIWDRVPSFSMDRISDKSIILPIMVCSGVGGIGAVLTTNGILSGNYLEVFIGGGITLFGFAILMKSALK